MIKRKILCLIDTLEMGGGAERQMGGLAGFLFKTGYNVTLATYHKHNSNDYIEKKYGIRPVLINTKPNPVSKFLAIKKYISYNHFDTVIVYKDGAAMISCIVKWLNDSFFLVVSERNTTQRLNLRERVKFFLYRQADVIVPNSSTQGEFISRNYTSLSSKVRVITNFTDTNYFKPIAKSSNGVVKILVTARIAEQKNVLGFLKTVRLLKEQGCNIKIDWYGNSGVDQYDYEQKVKKLYRNLEINDTLTFYPATHNILLAYQSCDIFCLPSFYEGYPNVICEAMSCGKPILCSNVCDNSAIIEEGVNGFMFNPWDIDSMTNVISSTVRLPESQLQEMGRKSRMIAEKKFSEGAFLEKYIHIIKSA